MILPEYRYDQPNTISPKIKTENAQRIVGVVGIEGRQVDDFVKQMMEGVFEGAGQDLPVEADRYERILLQIDRLVAGASVIPPWLTVVGASLLHERPVFVRLRDKFDSLNAQSGGFENGADFWATMPKACPKGCGVFDVRWNALLAVHAIYA